MSFRLPRLLPARAAIQGDAQLPNDFVIFCDTRTGSYNLVSRLNSCPDVVCHGEIFKKDRIEVSRFHRRRLSIGDAHERNVRAMAFIRELRSINPGKHFGFKIFAGQLGWAPGAVEYVVARETRRILLMRPPLEIYASRLRAHKTGIWTVKTADKITEAPLREPVRFTEESFANFALQYNRYAVTSHMLVGLPGTFVLHYSQMGDPTAMDALLGFLGSRSVFADTSSEYHKQYDGSLEEAFSNWDELMAGLARLPPLLDAPLPSVPFPAAGDRLSHATLR